MAIAAAYTQPAILVLEMALVESWNNYGIHLLVMLAAVILFTFYGSRRWKKTDLI